MNKAVAFDRGAGLGAALMYIFDPDRGERRRALISDARKSDPLAYFKKMGSWAAIGFGHM